MWLANRLHFIFKTEYYNISLEHAFSTLWKPEWLTRSQKSLLHVKLSKNFPVGKKYSLPKESSSLQHFSTSSIWWSSISSSKGWLPFRSEPAEIRENFDKIVFFREHSAPWKSTSTSPQLLLLLPAPTVWNLSCMNVLYFLPLFPPPSLLPWIVSFFGSPY